MPNRLAQETSPYLLQHAHNPVDWYPWGAEALGRAKTENRPIVLSIGYSACHWCHVMERESFEDEQTAAFMNEHFVNVKVDREERPDVDAIYMRAVQALTGHGGWPLTAFLTPDAKPFFGGTYFPPEPRHGMASFRQVLQATWEAFTNKPDDVGRAADQLVQVIARSAAPSDTGSETGDPGPGLLDEATRLIVSQFDPANGGFGGAPKFPQPLVLEHLLREHQRTGESEPLRVVVHTLRQMARGGLRDQLDGGFHRYTVDAKWLVPHFEKMLYDNALLPRVYLHAFQLTGDAELEAASRGALDYCLDDLRDPGGGFYAARDADSEGEEGLFYLWSVEEVQDLLGDGAALFMRVYDVSPTGNFEGQNILHVPHDLEAIARAEGLAPETLAGRLAQDRNRLREARIRRVHPLRDDKVLSGWTALLLRSLAEAGGALGQNDYVDAAVQGADFVLDHMRANDRLLHVWSQGRARIPGFLEDYGALGNALLTLHEVTLDGKWLDGARWCADRILALFRDVDSGLFYDSPSDGEELVIRPRETMDNATPSGTSLAVELMLRSATVFGTAEYRQAAVDSLRSEAPIMARYPVGFGRMLSNVDRLLSTAVEVALLGAPNDPRTRALQAAVLEPFIPNRIIVGAEDDDLRELPLLEGRSAENGSPTAFVCRNYVCQLPVTEPDALRDQLP